jgi:hypothetical protein
MVITVKPLHNFFAPRLKEMPGLISSLPGSPAKVAVNLSEPYPPSWSESESVDLRTARLRVRATTSKRSGEKRSSSYHKACVERGEIS